MAAVGAPTLDQLRVFLAIVETGSFSAAARRLNRQQSVVSYTIANLEAQLGGLSLFERRTHRPRLTDAGQAILADARRLALDLGALQARARGLLSGLEAEVAVAVDVMLPTCRLVDALARFRERFPTVTLRLYVEALGSVSKLVREGTCAIGISGPMIGPLDDLVQRPVGTITMVPVVAPAHPLAQLPPPLSRDDVRDHVQLVLTDRSELTLGRDFGVESVQSWRFADLGAKHALLRQGLGWGNMPQHMVREDLAFGRLVQLEISDRSPAHYTLMAVHRTGEPPGPASAWLMAELSGGSPDEDLGAEPPDQAAGPSRSSQASAWALTLPGAVPP